jgi:7-cyano-7-deazaguanine synthase
VSASGAMPPAPIRALALLSGGLDSGVAAACFRAEAGQQLAGALFFDYGQRAVARERAAAQRLAQRFATPFVEVALPWLGDLAHRAGSALVDRRASLPHGSVERPGDAASAAAVWVPARNAVFVAVAAAHAEAIGATHVVAGFNREEAATFPDNSPAFVRAAGAFLACGTRSGVQVTSPTLELDKAGIVAQARRLGFGPDDFWSCYEGGAVPCGRCESCLRSRWR